LWDKGQHRSIKASGSKHAFFCDGDIFSDSGALSLYTFGSTNDLLRSKTLPHEKSVGEHASDSLDGCTWRSTTNRKAKGMQGVNMNTVGCVLML
jgi:hypothetical protein